MKLLFITENYSPKNYGVSTIVSQLSDEITCGDPDTQVMIISTGKEIHSIPNRVLLQNIPPLMNNAWRWSPALQQKLDHIVSHYHPDLIHVHGVWMAIQWAALSISKSKDIPSIISPHGMLESWFWNTQSMLKRLKKNLYLFAILKKQLSTKTYFHAITSQEINSIQRCFNSNNVKVIPNAIKMMPMVEDGDEKLIKNKKTVTFLGRLHPKKGVHVLIEAFASSSADEDWQLIIAGPEEDQRYVSSLKKTVYQLGLEKSVRFIGTVWGVNKLNLLHDSWIVVVPSFSEVIGMVNLEAGMNMVPSITTFETGLLDWEKSGGLLVHPTVKDLANALSNCMNWKMAERIERGLRAYSYVNEHFSWPAVLPLWREFYSAVANDMS